MIPFRERIKHPGVIVADGAMGTMLFARGLKPGECPEKINLEQPELLQEIASLYLDAGAEILQTNTFGASPLKLSPYSLEKKSEEINARAVQAVRDVVDKNAYVAGSCGPTGKLLEPYGDTQAEIIYKAYERQMKVLIDEGVDMICLETITDLNEAVLAIKAVRSISSSIPICATMTFDKTPNGFITIMGVTVRQAATCLAETGADIIGSNCGNGIVNMLAIGAEFKKHSAFPIMIQSNAGVPSLKDGISIFPESPEFMAEKSRGLLESGIKILGGCCGTTPEHISKFKKVVEEYNSGLGGRT